MRTLCFHIVEDSLTLTFFQSDRQDGVGVVSSWTVIVIVYPHHRNPTSKCVMLYSIQKDMTQFTMLWTVCGHSFVK